MSKPLKILILEDSLDDTLLLIRELKKGGYEPDYKMIETEEDMKKSLSEEDWDLILSDYYMPNFSAMKALQIISEEKIDLPFIIVSGAIGEETAVEAMKAGAQDFIMKGSYNRLIPAIERELQESIHKRQIKEAQETIKKDEIRFKALYKLSQMEETSKIEMASYVIKVAIEITNSKMGYIGFFSKDKTKLIINKQTLICEGYNYNFNDNDEIILPIEDNVLWKELILKKEYIIKNEITTSYIKKVCLSDNRYIYRLIGIPVFNMNDPVLLAVVGNKKTEYNKRDVEQLQLLLKGMYQNIQKRDAEERIKKSLQEKNILLKEIHHRVKNNLQIISSLLNLQSRSIDNEKYLNIFKESQNRIRTMALVHEKLYQSDDLGHINLPNYLYNVAMNLFHSYRSNSREINLKTDIEDISMDIELAIPCGLIVNELISNSIKYAFPEDRHGKINLEVKLMNDEFYEMVIKDDGIGIPDSISFEKTPSLGLQLVRALVNQINGEMSLFKNNGTKFVIKFNKHILDDKDINND